MSKVFFTSDTHISHTNIIKYSKRPFVVEPETPTEPGPLSTAFMNEEIIRRWNSVVGPNDSVWHLGDVFFGRYTSEQADAVLARLNGQIDLIRGNHDDDYIWNHPRFRSRQLMAEIREKDRAGKKHTVVLCHYGMRVWNNSFRGSLQLYGHSHGTLPGNNQSLDVGSDCWDHTPVTIDQILARMRSNPPRNHEFKKDNP